MRHTALLAILLSAASAGAQVVLNSGATLLIDEREPGPVRKAAQDLAADLESVFGKPVRVVHDVAAAGRTTICVALQHNLPAGLARPAGREVLAIRALEAPWPGSRVEQAVVLTGSDVRGAIYAIYQFSQEFLGVDPLYWWTDHAPPRRANIRIPPRFAETAGPPAFRYRGWFINDEDLLTGWKPGAKDGTGIALEVWNRIFEALLRLKGNMIVPGTFIFPDEAQVRAAGARGLVVTQHHIEVLGLNTYRWPDEQPYSFPGALPGAWSATVGQYAAGQEVIWTVGYRGRHDRPFWSDDPAAGATDAERARTIRAAIDRQMEIVRRARRAPYFLMNAWMEAVPLLRRGLLAIPPGVHLVWPDNGHGILRDDGAIAAGQGVYYHTAMYNSRANQLTEMVPLARIERELGRAARAGATEYLLVNTSDLRPVLMTTRAVMELAWKPASWSADAYLLKWCREEFGDAAAPGVAACYRAYFSAPARYGQEEQATMADNYYHTTGRELLVRQIKGDAVAPSNLADLCREADARWQKVMQLARLAEPHVPPDRRDFFQAHVLTQAAIHLHSNRMLMYLAKGDAPTAAPEIEAVLVALHAAETGKWAGFYRGDLFVNVRHSLALARAATAKRDGREIPANVPIAVRPQDPYVVLKAYQGDRRVALR